MKHFLASMLILAVLLGLCACSSADSPEKPISYYYPVAQLQYDASGTVISAETREGSQLTTLNAMLELYLNGPVDPAYKNPFPQGLQLQTVVLTEDTLYLTFSDELAALSGMELTVACCAITLTCLELTTVTYVSIRTESALLGGEKSITMNRDCLLLLDRSGEAEN